MPSSLTIQVSESYIFLLHYTFFADVYQYEIYQTVDILFPIPDDTPIVCCYKYSSDWSYYFIKMFTKHWSSHYVYYEGPVITRTGVEGKNDKIDNFNTFAFLCSAYWNCPIDKV